MFLKYYAMIYEDPDKGIIKYDDKSRLLNLHDIHEIYITGPDENWKYALVAIYSGSFDHYCLLKNDKAIVEDIYNYIQEEIQERKNLIDITQYIYFI